MSDSHFHGLLKQSLAIHDLKAKDYTTNPGSDPHENFVRATTIAGWFPPAYTAHTVLIGTKLARLAALLSTRRKPNNESIDDSFLDLLTYIGLWYSYYKDIEVTRNPEQLDLHLPAARPEDIPTAPGMWLRTQAPIGQAEAPIGQNKCDHSLLNASRICLSCKEYMINEKEFYTWDKVRALYIRK